MSRRIRIQLAYDGTDFHGWQVQPGLPTVQGLLEELVSGIEKKHVHVAGSGRTDAGVHALAQVAAFTLENPLPLPNLQMAINRHLPPAIRIFETTEVHPQFHPRFDSLAKTYRYVIFRDNVCSPFDYRYVHCHPYPLDEDPMLAAAPVFIGSHDFSAFAAKDESRDSEGKSKVRKIHSSSLERKWDRIVYTVRGSGFLKHMVRNLVGSLLEVGKGNLNAGDLAAFLQPDCKRRAGPTVPAKGLTMVSVEYPGDVANEVGPMTGHDTLGCGYPPIRP